MTGAEYIIVPYHEKCEDRMFSLSREISIQTLNVFYERKGFR
jgi:hypothetical protein